MPKTRCTAEVEVLLGLPSYRGDEVERQMDDAWMCQALSGPQPAAPDVRRLFLDLSDIANDIMFTADAAADESRKVLATARGEVRDWFMAAVAGLPRIELAPEELWALFQLVDRFGYLVNWFDTGSNRWMERLSPNDDVWTYTDFDEPAVVAGG